MSYAQGSPPPGPGTDWQVLPSIARQAIPDPAVTVTDSAVIHPCRGHDTVELKDRGCASVQGAFPGRFQDEEVTKTQRLSWGIECGITEQSLRAGTMAVWGGVSPEQLLGPSHLSFFLLLFHPYSCPFEPALSEREK